MHIIGFREVPRLWVPRVKAALQASLVVCANMIDVEHRGVRVPLHRLGGSSVWEGMEQDVVEFVGQYCAARTPGWRTWLSVNLAE